MTDRTPVTDDLDSRGIPYQVFRHPGPVTSLEQAARERGQRRDQVIRSLLFRLSERQYVMVLVAGPAQVDWRALRHHLGLSRLTTASQEEVLEATGYRIGSVSPFGLPQPIRILVDHSLIAQDGEVSIGSGQVGVTIIMEADDLLRTLGDVESGVFTQAT